MPDISPVSLAAETLPPSPSAEDQEIASVDETSQCALVECLERIENINAHRSMNGACCAEFWEEKGVAESWNIFCSLCDDPVTGKA